MKLPDPPNKGEPIRAEMFRQLIDYMRSITPVAGPNVKVSHKPGGTLIEVATGGKAVVAPNLAPFTVRLHKTDDDPDGLWEIYLPSGCCNVGGPCDPLNPPANDTTGHEDDDPAWRSLGTIERWEALVPEDWTEVDGIQETPRRVVVEIHVKPSAKEYGVDNINSPARRLVWASLRDDVEAVQMRSYANLNSYAQGQIYKDTPGDVWSCDVATILHVRRTRSTDGGYGYEELTPSITVKQHRTTPVDVAVPQGTGISNFDLVWCLAVVEGNGKFSLALEVKAVYCVRQLSAAAGITITGDTMTDVLNAAKIYARVNVTDLAAGTGIVNVLKDPEGVSISQPYVVWLPLYDMTHNTITADYRAQSLTNLQLFHA